MGRFGIIVIPIVIILSLSCQKVTTYREHGLQEYIYYKHIERIDTTKYGAKRIFYQKWIPIWKKE